MHLCQLMGELNYLRISHGSENKRYDLEAWHLGICGKVKIGKR